MEQEVRMSKSRRQNCATYWARHRADDAHRPDISRADFTWCMIAVDWRWSI